MLGQTFRLQAVVVDAIQSANPRVLLMTKRLLLLLLPLHVLTLAPAALAATPPGPEAPQAGGMLRPGWQAVAEQALEDIRGAVLQGAAGSNPAPDLDSRSAQPVIDRFTQSSAAAGAPIEGGDRLVAGIWQAYAAQPAAQDGAADRIARAFSVGNAAMQLGQAVNGGPNGAAAYAAWWAYQRPGASAGQALRVALFTGYALWDAEKNTEGAGLPASLAQRSTVAAALGGLAVAAAGGGEQALREVFFGTGAAVLLQDGAQLYCLSATVQCQRPPAQAALHAGGRFAGWAVDRLPPVAATGAAFAATAAAGAGHPLSHPAGSLPLGDGWVLSWHAAPGAPPELLMPLAVLARGTASTTAVAGAAEPAPSAAAAPLPAQAGLRYRCVRAGDTRTIWLVPGDPKAGYVCRTMYQISNTRAVLWNARQNPEVCQAKAEAQLARERAQGYQCQQVSTP